MPKLSQYIEQAATEYLQEKGAAELDACWVAEFFQDSGLVDEYPRQNLITFFALVQKALTIRSERAAQETQRHLEKAGHGRKLRRRA
jgi:hypothetical protein